MMIIIFISWPNTFSLKLTPVISVAVERSRVQNPLVTMVFNKVGWYSIFCRDFKEPARLLWLHTKKKTKDVCARRVSQVSWKLQRSAAERKQNYCCFLQTAAKVSSNETIKNDFLDRRGRPLYGIITNTLLCSLIGHTGISCNMKDCI